MRLSQEVGAHRRRRKPAAIATVEDELWKRAFWSIVIAVSGFIYSSDPFSLNPG